MRASGQALLPFLVGLPLLAGCPTGFVDSHPPVLEGVERSVSVPPVDAPTVYEVIFDVHLANPSDCSATLDRMVSSARAAMLPSGAIGAELPMLDLTGGTCRQQADRTIDPSWITGSLAGPEATWGTANVRPVLLYLNNVDLALPAGIKSGLAEFNAAQASRGAPPQLLWGIVSAKARKDATYDRAAAWTYAQDPALFSGIAGFAQADLPLRKSGTIPPIPLFTAAQSARLLQFKGCRADPRISGINFAFTGAAEILMHSSPPQIQVAQANPFPQPRSTFKEGPAIAVAEGCSANCDRFLYMSNGLDRWDRHSGCATQ